MGDTGEIGLREHVSNTRHQWSKHRIVREYDKQQKALRLSLAAMKLVSIVWIDETWKCPSCYCEASAVCRGDCAPDCQLDESIKRVEGVLGE